MTAHQPPSVTEFPLGGRSIVASTSVASPRGRMDPPLDPPDLVGRFTPIGTRLRQTIRELDEVVHFSNLLTLGADLEAASHDEPANPPPAAQDGVAILTVLANLQRDTTQAVMSMDGVASILEDLELLVRRVAGGAPKGEFAPIANETRAAPECDVVRTLDGAARALARQADAFQSISTCLDGTLDVLEQLVRESDALAPLVGGDSAPIAEAGARTALAAHLTAISFSHLRWRNELVRGVASRTEPSIETDPTRCALGCWLDTHEPRCDEETELLARIRPLHEKFHRAAAGIIDQIHCGARARDVLEVIEREVAPAFGETWALLMHLVGSVQESAAAAVSALRRTR